MAVRVGRKVRSRSWMFTAMVKVAMAFGMAPAVPLGLGLAFERPWWGVVLLLPLFPVLLAAFLRPTKRIPEGPVHEVGYSLGHHWAEIGDETVWVDAATARELTTWTSAEVEPQPTLAGFVLDVPAPARRLPEAQWVVGTAHRALQVFALLVLLGGTLVSNGLLELGPGLHVALGAAAAGEDVVGLLFQTGITSLVGAFCASVALAILMIPYHLLTALGLGLLRKDGTATRVELEGRILSWGDQRFHLAAPGRRVHLDWDGSGSVLVLESDRERSTIRGRHAELVWLESALNALPVEDVGEEAVPEGLARLRAARAREPG